MFIALLQGYHFGMASKFSTTCHWKHRSQMPYILGTYCWSWWNLGCRPVPFNWAFWRDIGRIWSCKCLDQFCCVVSSWWSRGLCRTRVFSAFRTFWSSWRTSNYTGMWWCSRAHNYWMIVNSLFVFVISHWIRSSFYPTTSWLAEAPTLMYCYSHLIRMDSGMLKILPEMKSSHTFFSKVIDRFIGQKIKRFGTKEWKGRLQCRYAYDAMYRHGDLIFGIARSMWESKVVRGQSSEATQQDKGMLWTWVF